MLAGGMAIVYPWLKGHGSIEGAIYTLCPTEISSYPWLKGHGSIEGYLGGNLRNYFFVGYPWLKGHGSIEGRA